MNAGAGAVAPYRSEVSIAAVNGPAERGDLGAAGGGGWRSQRNWRREGVKSRELTVSHAFHSPLMEPMLAEFRQVAESITYHEPQLRAGLERDGQAGGRGGDDGRSTGCGTCARRCVLPMGWPRCRSRVPASSWRSARKPMLLGMVGPEVAGSRRGGAAAASLRGSQADWQQMLRAWASCTSAGLRLTGQGVARNGEEAHGRRKVVLPTYPFQRQRYWIDVSGRERGSGVLSPLLDKMMQLPASNEVVFETAMSAVTLPFFRDHRVYETVVAPGACHVAMVLNAAAIALAGEEGRDQALHVTDVIFPQALVLGGEERRTAQIVLSPMGGEDKEGERRFQLFSFVQTEPGMAPATTLHAQGVAGVCDRAVEGPTLRELQGRFTAAADVEALLAADASPLVFGPAFQWLEAAWHAPRSTTEGSDAAAASWSSRQHGWV